MYGSFSSDWPLVHSTFVGKRKSRLSTAEHLSSQEKFSPPEHIFAKWKVDLCLHKAILIAKVNGLLTSIFLADRDSRFKGKELPPIPIKSGIIR